MDDQEPSRVETIVKVCVLLWSATLLSLSYYEPPSGKKIVDFKKNNLHLLGYSQSINLSLKLVDLKKNIFSLPKQPNAVPYVTSYYKKNWGFCKQGRHTFTL